MTRRLGFLARLLLTFFLIGGAVSGLVILGLKMIRDFTKARCAERDQSVVEAQKKLPADE